MNTLRQALLTLLFLSVTLTTGTAKGAVTYFHHDALGSVVAATDENGAVLWRENYKPYGDRLTRAVSTDEQSVYYTGKPHDDHTGLTYFGARYYDPLIGRFMGIDPVGVDLNKIHSFNRYAYANNNPYKYVDPDGNLAFLAPLFLFAAKEVGAEAFERTTGLPALFSIKGAAKAIGKKLGISGGKKATSEAARGGGGDSNLIFRTGSQTDNALTDASGVSFRDSISSAASGSQTFRPGDKIFAVDTNKLPLGSVVRDGTPPGHVTVNATPEQIRNAVTTDVGDNALSTLKPLNDKSFRLPK